jgi:hypothetical protein
VIVNLNKEGVKNLFANFTF